MTTILPTPAEKAVLDDLADDWREARETTWRTYRARAALMLVHLADARGKLEALGGTR
jgi:hypothetical protein